MLRESLLWVNELAHLDLLMRRASAFSPASPQSIFHVVFDSVCSLMVMTMMMTMVMTMVINMIHTSTVCHILKLYLKSMELNNYLQESTPRKSFTAGWQTCASRLIPSFYFINLSSCLTSILWQKTSRATEERNVDKRNVVPGVLLPLRICWLRHPDHFQNVSAAAASLYYFTFQNNKPPGKSEKNGTGWKIASLNQPNWFLLIATTILRPLLLCRLIKITS